MTSRPRPRRRRGSGIASGSGRSRRCDVLDDEDLFAGPDEPQVAAGDFFNGCGVFAQAPRLVAQAQVFGALAGDLRGELVVLLTRAEHRQQSAIANQTVDDGHGRHEDQQKLDDSVASRRPFRRLGPALRAWSSLLLGHARTTVQQFRKKYNIPPP